MAVVLQVLAGVVGGVILYVVLVCAAVDFVCGPCQRAALWLIDHGQERLALRVLLFGLWMLVTVHGGSDSPAVRLQQRYKAQLTRLGP